MKHSERSDTGRDTWRSAVIGDNAVRCGLLIALFFVALIGYVLPVAGSVRKATLAGGPVIVGFCGFLIAVLQLREARRVPREHPHYAGVQRHGWGWFLIGCGWLCSACGDMLCAAGYWRDGVQPQIPSPVDGFSLLLYPFLTAGLICLFRLDAPLLRLRQLADAAIASAAAFLITWQIAVFPLWHTSHGSLGERVIAIAYPLCDVMALFCALALAVAATRTRRDTPTYLPLCAGIASWMLADTLLAHHLLGSRYETGAWFDIFWTAGQVGVAMAATGAWGRLRSLIAQTEMTPQQIRENIEAYDLRPHPHTGLGAHRLWLPSRVQSVLPYSLTTGAILITIMHQILSYKGQTIVGGSAAVLILLIMVRQGLTLVENRRLLTALRTTGAALQVTVQERNEQLSILHELIVAMNDNLSEEDVLAAALDHAQRALRADAVALWLVESEHSEVLPLCRFHQAPDALTKQSVPTQLQYRSWHEKTQIDPLLPLGADGELLATPLLAQGKRLGLIGALRWKASFDEPEGAVVEGIGRAAGTALFNARAFHEAREAADRDPLTALLNHRSAQEKCSELLRTATLDKEVGFLMVDVDDFKRLNDTRGHLIGDALLRHVADTLVCCCPPQAIVGRWGGDEFLAVIPNFEAGHGAQEMAALIHTIEEALVGKAAIGADDMPRATLVSVSIGTAIFPGDGTTRDVLFAHADQDMYRAKRRRKAAMTHASLSEQLPTSLAASWYDPSK